MFTLRTRMEEPCTVFLSYGILLHAHTPIIPHFACSNQIVIIIVTVIDPVSLTSRGPGREEGSEQAIPEPLQGEVKAESVH